MNFEIFIFGLLILLFDIPFITFVMAPMYKNIGLAKNTKVIFVICAINNIDVDVIGAVYNVVFVVVKLAVTFLKRFRFTIG